jgi:hypothetical protein
MATLMEFAAASLDRDGGSRATGPAPPAIVAPPVLHWGSAGRAALDARGVRRARLLVVATRGCGVRALGMALQREGLRKEGMLVLEEVGMRGSALEDDAPFDGDGVCALWGSPDGLLVLSIGAAIGSWRGHSIAAVLASAVCADRVVVLDELPLRHCAIDVDLDEGWETGCALIRKLPTDAEAQRCADAGPEKGNDLIQQCPLLESGVVVDGVAAAALTDLHLRAVPAVVYVGLSREAPGSVARAHVHEDPSFPLADIIRAELALAGLGVHATATSRCAGRNSTASVACLLSACASFAHARASV